MISILLISYIVIAIAVFVLCMKNSDEFSYVYSVKHVIVLKNLAVALFWPLVLLTAVLFCLGGFTVQGFQSLFSYIKSKK